MFLLICILLYCNCNISYVSGFREPKLQNYSRILHQLVRQPASKVLWTPIEDEEISENDDPTPPAVHIQKRLVYNKNNHRKKSQNKAKSDRQLLNQYHRLVSSMPTVHDTQVAPSNTKGETYPTTKIEEDNYQISSNYGSTGWASSHHHQHHHHHDEHHKGHDVHYGHKGYADYALIGLSALALGTFLLNSLWNLFALASSYFFTTGTGTGTGGVITTTGGTNGGGTSTGGTNTGGTITTTSTSTSTGGGITVGGRRRRSVLELHVDPRTSFDVMSLFILNSIEVLRHKHECLPHSLCVGNKQAKVLGNGFQYIIPWFSFVAVYKGKEEGLLENFSEHVRAIIRGLSEANCQSEFPEC